MTKYEAIKQTIHKIDPTIKVSYNETLHAVVIKKRGITRLKRIILLDSYKKIKEFTELVE